MIPPTGGRRRSWVAPFFSAVVFVMGIAMMVLLADPPEVVAGIIAVVVVGVLLRTFAPSSVWGRAWRRRTGTRAAAHRRPGTTPDAIVEPEW
jgi:hypothetical protein